jgi:hypothetical protein
MSTAEAESNILTLAALASSHVRHTWMQIRHDDPSRAFTVPIFTDSMAALAISSNDRDTRRTRHIDRRYMLHRSMRKNCLIAVYHLAGDEFQIADITSKQTQGPDSEYKLATIEAPLLSFAQPSFIRNRGGVMDSSDRSTESKIPMPMTNVIGHKTEQVKRTDLASHT